MEDLDGPRVRPEFNDAALRDLRWLGIDWDVARVQSKGLPRLAQALEDLVSRGLAYPCTCSRAEILRALSAPQHGVAEARYPGTCRGRYTSVQDARERSGGQVGIRFFVQPGEVTVQDHFAASEVFNVESSVGDFMIGRRDGTPAYQLAVVLDDSYDGVSEVVRGDDLLPSTARQLLLQQALGLPAPDYFHVPLVVDEHGRRLAKREKDASLASFRESGVDPRRIVNWVAESAGLPAGELAAARDYVADFDIGSVPSTNVTLTKATLASFRG